MSVDPLTIHGAGADLNPYAYVRGKALANRDPMGLSDEKSGSNNVVSAVVNFVGGVISHIGQRVAEAARSVTQGLAFAGAALVDPIRRNGLSPSTLAQSVVGAASYLLEGLYTAAGTLTFLEPVGRRLSAAEAAGARGAFGNSLDLDPIRVKEGFSLRGALFGAHASGNNIWGMSRIDGHAGLHELVHVWQQQHGSGISRGLKGEADWRKSAAAGVPWERLGVEAQAALVPEAYEYEKKLNSAIDASSETSGAPESARKWYGAGRMAPVMPVLPMAKGGTKTDMGGYGLEALLKLRAGHGAPK